MSRLEVAQLRAILREMSREELEDMICALNLTYQNVAQFLDDAVHTEEYAARVLAHCKQKLDILFSYTNRSGILRAAKRVVSGFAAAAVDEAALLELQLYMIEGAMRWAFDTETPSVFGGEIIEMFADFVRRLNRQRDDAAFRGFHSRIARLELDADMLGWSFGESLSESCLDIRWWGAN